MADTSHSGSSETDPQDPVQGGMDAAAAAHRNQPKFSLKHRLLRAVWGIVWGLLASWTPPQLGAWRRMLLRAFGADIHPTASVRGGARVWYPPNLTMKPYAVLADGVECYCMNTIVIGENTIVSQRAFLCGGTHDFRKASHPLITKPITIGNDVWIAAEAFIAPGIDVPDGCVIGARAVVTGPLEPWSVYAGNPARKIKDRSYAADA